MSSQNPSVAVVIIHWNNRNLLEKFLPSVLQSTYKNLKVYVADNASTDDSIAFLKLYYPQINIIALPNNYGYAGGYNKAIEQINEEYLILLNNDVEVSPGWIEPVIEAMLADDIAAAQPKLLQYSNKNRFEYAGAAGGYLDIFGYAFCKGRLFEEMENDQGQYNGTYEVFWASGACLFIKRKAFLQAGGFDESFFAHMEEIDLCWRLQLLGYKILAVNSSEVYHLGGGTLQKVNAQKTYLNFKNNLVMLTKNLPLTTLFWLIPVRSFLDLLSSIFFLMNALPKHSWAVHRAHAHYFFNLGKLLKNAGKQKNKLPFKKLKGIFYGSVVYQHFVKKQQSIQLT